MRWIDVSAFEQAGDVKQRAKGTGLGLSLVRGLAELHGGELIIESTLGEGSVFTVFLRRHAAQVRESAAAS